MDRQLLLAGLLIVVSGFLSVNYAYFKCANDSHADKKYTGKCPIKNKDGTDFEKNYCKICGCHAIDHNND